MSYFTTLDTKADALTKLNASLAATVPGTGVADVLATGVTGTGSAVASDAPTITSTLTASGTLAITGTGSTTGFIALTNHSTDAAGAVGVCRVFADVGGRFSFRAGVANKMTFTGSLTNDRIYTFPDATCTLLYSGGALGTPASGTVTNLTGTASININGTVGATTPDTGAFTTLSTTGIYTAAGTRVSTASAMGALAIDVTKGYNTKTVSADQTFTFSGTPGATNQWFGMFVTNSDSASHVLTIPSSFSIGRAGAITTVTIPASGKLFLQWNYDGSAYNIYGDPPATSGTGSFALTTSPTFVTPILGTPTSGTLTNCTIPASGITAGVLGGTITLGESTGNILLDAALSADGKWSGITEAGTAGATLAFGDICYLAVADSRWELTDANAEATSGPVKLGICVLAAASDGDPTVMLLYGKVRADTAFPTLTVGAPAYISTTAGDIQVAQPSGTDDVIRVVGYGNTGDELYFCPDPTYITHT